MLLSFRGGTSAKFYVRVREERDFRLARAHYKSKYPCAIEASTKFKEDKGHFKAISEAMYTM